MSKFNIELYGRECEIAREEQDGGDSLILEFDRPLDGYVTVGGITARFKGRCCAIDVRGLPEGEYLPHLILPEMTLDLPTLKKEGGRFIATGREGGYLGRLSLRERRLSARIDEIEKRLDELTNKVLGSSIF